MSQRYRNCVFTINNYEDIDMSEVLQLPRTYLIIGEEVGEEGTPHLQGYIEFGKQMRFATLKKLVPRAHWENRRGTAKEASDYCKKEGQFTEYGVMSNPGKRNDLTYIKEEVLEKGRIKPILGDVWNVQQLKFAEGLLKYCENKRDSNEPVFVKWLWGKPGLGKSKIAIEEFEKNDEEYYRWTNLQGKWFDGYDGEKNVIFDDLRPDDFKYTELLALLDRHECRVQFKGGVRQFMGTKIIITSSMHPTAFKCFGEDNGQLLRRINVIEKYDGEKVVSEAQTQESGGNTRPPKSVHSLKSLVTGVAD